jgi:hypothetical protein
VKEYIVFPKLKGDAFMKSTRFYIKSLAITALMLAGVMQAGEDMAESIARGFGDLTARRAAEQAAAAGRGFWQSAGDYASYLPRKAWGATTSAAGWTGEKLGQFGGYMASKSPEFAQKWIAEHPVLAATGALAAGGLVAGASAYGAKAGLDRYKGAQAAKQYYKEVVDLKGFEGAGSLLMLETLYANGKKQYGPYLSPAENQSIDEQFQARKMALASTGEVQQEDSEEAFMRRVLEKLNELVRRTDALLKTIGELQYRLIKG